MKSPRVHMLVCAGFRVGSPVQGTCAKRGSVQLLEYLTSELSDRGMGDVLVSPTGCLGYCAEGPVIAVYPLNRWFGSIENEEAVDRLLDEVEQTLGDSIQE
ncbi:MAG: (2Fe-2S) ferredoxin domain-containing protein [Treponemataceae bacterium]|nr:(2Fe-2S) ferredoxin domain-containing protein [Treponemataceae bacterium]